MEMNYTVPEYMFGKGLYNSVKVKNQIDAIDEILRNEEEREKYRSSEGEYISFTILFMSHSGRTTVTTYEFDVIRRFFAGQGWPVVQKRISGLGADIDGIFLAIKHP